MKSFLLDLKEIDQIVKEVKQYLIKFNNDCIVILRGDLASGKTTFVKNFASSLGIKDEITSPTFSIQSVYNELIYHYDVYNKTLEEFISLGLLEEFEKKGIHFVEWGDEKLEEILKSYGFNVMVLKIEKIENKRRYILNG